MVEQLTLPKRPTAPAESVEVALAEAVPYGRHYFLKPWEQRTFDQQDMLEQRISAFQNWRRQEGEYLPNRHVWELPPPDAGILRRYIIKTSLCYPHHCYQVNTALRVYLKYWRRPDLFRMVMRVKV